MCINTLGGFMNLFRLSLIAIFAILITGCSVVPENVKLGVVKLNAAAQLMSPHNMAHCKAKIEELESRIAELPDGPKKNELLAELENERIYLRANEIMPDTTQELEDWAFERELEDE